MSEERLEIAMTMQHVAQGEGFLAPFDVIGSYEDELETLRQSLESTQANLDAAQSLAQQAVEDRERTARNAHDSAIEMAASYLERVGDYGSESKANAIRGEAFEDWEKFKRERLSSTPKTEGRTDGERLDWLESQSKSSRTGISFEYVRHVEEGQILEKGYRFMRRHFLGERKGTLRQAIDAAMSASLPTPSIPEVQVNEGDVEQSGDLKREVGEG